MKIKSIKLTFEAVASVETEEQRLIDSLNLMVKDTRNELKPKIIKVLVPTY